jgi:DNA-directed RNA polymerase specialized sigma24 family protein
LSPSRVSARSAGDPAGWLDRAARNLAIDGMRRERIHDQALLHLAENAERESSRHEAHFADEIGDGQFRRIGRREIRVPGNVEQSGKDHPSLSQSAI